MELPPKLEKFLASIGVNTVRLKWKLHDLEKWWERRKEQKDLSKGKRRYKNCRCGRLYLAEDKVCEACGRKLPSYTAYRLTRLLAIGTPAAGWISISFLVLIALLYALQVFTFGASSLMIPSRDALVRFGALSGDLFRGTGYFRILTMALVHIGFIHILFNAVAISQMLPRFEDEIGPWATLVLITLTQLVSGIAHLVNYPPQVITGGASGIAFGLIGFGVVYFKRLRRAAESRFFFHWFLYGLAFGFFIRANNAAHIGGFLTGLPLGYILAGRASGIRMRKYWKIPGLICLAAWIAALVAIGVFY